MPAAEQSPAKTAPLTAKPHRGFVFAKNSPQLTMPVNLHGNLGRTRIRNEI
jgi:hypothetical protein